MKSKFKALVRRRAKAKGKSKGSRAANTKVDEKVVYRIRQNNSLFGATTVSNYFYSAFSPYNQTYANITSVPEFMAQANMFDEFCIKYLKVTYRPLYTQTPAPQPPGTPGTAWESTQYTAVDRDGKTPVSSSIDVPSKMLTYDSCREHQWNRKWSRTLKLKSFWLDASIPTHAPVGISTQEVTNAGYMQALIHYGQNCYAPIGVIGTYDLEFGVHFRGKKPVAFSYDASSGSVILTPVENFGNPITPGNTNLTHAQQGGDAYLACVDGDVVVRAQFDDAVANTGNAPIPSDNPTNTNRLL